MNLLVALALDTPLNKTSLHHLVGISAPKKKKKNCPPPSPTDIPPEPFPLPRPVKITAATAKARNHRGSRDVGALSAAIPSKIAQCPKDPAVLKILRRINSLSPY